MLTNITSHEAFFRLFSFFSIFLIMALAEWRFPKRVLSISKKKRWFNNLSLMLLNTLVLRALFPLAAVGFAAWCAQMNIGLFHLFAFPAWFSIAASVIALDGVIWLQHLLFHKVPLLWRLHRVHHVDLDLDITSGARFHPVEILLSMVIKCAAIAILGAPVVAVILFEVILSTMALFNHSNVALPLFIDKWLRKLLVTPDMHRVHHSVIPKEHHSNFGFNLSIWDRVFHTYCEQPKNGHYEMVIGLDFPRNEKDVVSLPGLLKLPFKQKNDLISSRKA